MEEKGITGGGVGILVLRQGKVLLGLRNSDATKASSSLHGEGTWTMPGGKMHFGETVPQVAARELQEETGLTSSNFTVFSVSNDRVPDAHFITIGTVCEDTVGEPQLMEPEEIIEWRWWPLDTLPPNIFPPSRKMAENYLAQRFFYPDQ